jgi:hypothetical protein
MSLLSVSTTAVTVVSEWGWRLLSVITEDDPTPLPLPALEIDENLVTPTWVGFALTFLMAVATVLIILDMMRRVRRTRYRAEVQEKLAAEAAADGSPDGSRDGSPDGTPDVPADVPAEKS